MTKSNKFNLSTLKLFINLIIISIFINSCNVSSKKDVTNILSNKADLIDYLVSSTWNAPLKLQDYNFNKDGTMNVKWKTNRGDDLIAGGKWILENKMIKITYNTTNTIRNGTEFLTFHKEDTYLILQGSDGYKYYRLGEKY
jgi:hypothetical protein